MRFEIAEPLSDVDGYFVYIPRSIVDLVSGQSTYLLERRAYATDEDYERGYNLTALMKGCILDCPAQRLIDGVEATARMVAHANYGLVFSIVSEEPLVIEPGIPVVPPSEWELPGALKQLDVANMTLIEIRDALQTEGAEPEDIATLLQLIGGLLA